MRILVTLTLLLFELLMITAHAVPASEPQNATVDVYEVQEAGKPKTTFVAPKPKKATLREIVYYHIIERPYGETVHLERSSDPEPLQIEMDETMRPFTNGHGYQFADTELHETENHDASPHSDAADNPEEEEHPKSLSEEVTEAESTEATTMENLKSDETTEITTEATEKEITTLLPDITTPSEEKKNRIRQRQFLFDRLKERYSANFKKPSTTEKEAITTTTEKTETTTIGSTATPTSTPAPVSTTMPTPAPARVKRGVNYEEIPLAPTLPPLDYSRYPGLRVYSGITPMYQTTVYPIDIEPSSEDDLKKAMKFKINDIFATMQPYDDNDRNKNNENKNDDKINENNDNKNDNNSNKNENNDDDIRVEKNNDGNDIRVDKHKPENKPKTYGMNLSEDQGVVWNNMWRPTNFHVGEPVKLYEVNEYEVSTITPVEKDNDPIETPATKPPRKETTTTTTPNPKDTEDIYVDVKKHKHTTTTARPKTEPKKEDTNDKKKKDNPSNEGEKEEDDNEAPKSIPKHKKKPNNTNQENPNNEAKPDLYEQLMNSDKFWKWLAHWTSNYMEVLSDRVKDMVKKDVAIEVAKEMKKYENAHQKVPLNQTKDESKPNNVTAPVKDDKNANNSTNSEEVLNKEPIIKNNTLVVDGKEIPITNTTNFDKGNNTDNNNFLRKHRDENKKPNNNKLPTDDEKKPDSKNKTASIEAQPNATKHEENFNDVKAQNVYGSATGNDKVTNIFIFYPGTDAEKIVDGLKPYLNNSVNGIAIKDDKKSDKDKKDEKVTEKPINSTPSANKEPENVTTQKPIQNNDKVENNKPVDDKKSTELEANKEPNSNSTDAKKPGSQDKKDNETKKNDTEKVPEKVETSNISPTSNSTTVNTEEAHDSNKEAPTSNLAPSNSTSTDPAKAIPTSVTPGANSTTISTH